MSFGGRNGNITATALQNSSRRFTCRSAAISYGPFSVPARFLSAFHNFLKAYATRFGASPHLVLCSLPCAKGAAQAGNWMAAVYALRLLRNVSNVTAMTRATKASNVWSGPQTKAIIAITLSSCNILLSKPCFHAKAHFSISVSADLAPNPATKCRAFATKSTFFREFIGNQGLARD